MPTCANVRKRARLRARTCVRSRMRIAMQASACVGVRTSAFAFPRVPMGLCALNCARALVCEPGCVCACACVSVCYVYVRACGRVSVRARMQCGCVLCGGRLCGVYVCTCVVCMMGVRFACSVWLR